MWKLETIETKGVITNTYYNGELANNLFEEDHRSDARVAHLSVKLGGKWYDVRSSVNGAIMPASSTWLQTGDES